ncbi:hypothetical protein [Mycobacteroides chelonae]|uniref:hypothetical protein n=1 Tax=Mycobacteroides chelonae TaxID=1774 RepID=UPI000AB19C94|nr:hypothetical protein [Mycobacteroides chelonae]
MNNDWQSIGRICVRKMVGIVLMCKHLVRASILLLTILAAGCQEADDVTTSNSLPTPASSPAVLPGLVVVKEVTPTYGSDLTDQRRLAGLADAIFVGEVKEVRGVILRHADIAYTKFLVNVKLGLKGGVSGVVTVEQQGGFDAKSNTRYIVKGDRPLEVGGIYILAVMHREKENTYNVINLYGDTLLTGADASAVTSDEPPVAVVKMRDAIANQIPS